MSSDFPFPILFKNESTNNNSNNNNTNNSGNSNISNRGHDHNNNNNSSNNNETPGAVKTEDENPTSNRQRIEIISLPISHSEHLSAERHKELLEAAITEQKVAYKNFGKLQELLHQYHQFDDSYLSVSKKINEKTLELIKWDSGVYSIDKEVVANEADRESAAKTLIDVVKIELGHLLYQKAHIEKVRRNIDRQIKRHRTLRQCAADELEIILAQLTV